MITTAFLEERPLSFSSIKEFAKSPKHYFNYIAKERTPPTDAMKLGSMVHCMMLQPELFNDMFVVAPDINKRTNAGKEEWAAFCEANKGKTVVDNSDYEHARRLSDNAMANPLIDMLIKECYDFESEFSSVIEDLPFKGIYDGIASGHIVEIKTINDGNPKNVFSDFYKRKYHLQGGLYHLASLGKPVFYVVVETSEPYISYVAQADDRYLKQGIDELGKLIDSFKVCMELNQFDKGYEFHYTDGISITLPWSVDK
jgi:hypothetical protein